MPIPPEVDYSNGTFWMRFTYCLNLVFLASPWLEIDFEAGHFAHIEQSKIDSHFADFFDSSKLVHFYYFGPVSLFTDFGQDIRPRKTICLTNNPWITYMI